MQRSAAFLVSFSLAGCAVRLPAPGQIGIAVKTTTRVDVRVQPPPPPQPIVEIQGAAVVEFFGVPLENAQDVVFVLDCSGSMSEIAQGRIAQYQAQPAPPPPPPPADPASAPGGVVVSPDPAQPPPDAPPPEAQAPPPVAPAAPRKIDVAQAELVDALQRLPAGTRMNVVFFNSDLFAFSPGMVPLEEQAREGFVGFVKDTVPTGATALAPAMRTAFLMNAKRIVLLSDGLGNIGGNAAAVLRDAREAMRGGVRIDAIGLGRGQDASLLGTLASESGGLYQAL